MKGHRSSMKLFVSGQGTYDPKRKICPAAERVKSILDKSKDGELFTTAQMAVLAGVAHNTIMKFTYELPGYSYRVSYGKKYWGKPATVAQLKRETEHEGHRRRKAGSAE